MANYPYYMVHRLYYIGYILWSKIDALKLIKKLWIESWYNLLRISYRVSQKSFWHFISKLYFSRNVSTLRRFFWLIVIASGWFYSRNRYELLILPFLRSMSRNGWSRGPGYVRWSMYKARLSLWIISNIWNILTRINPSRDQKTIQDFVGSNKIFLWSMLVTLASATSVTNINVDID